MRALIFGIFKSGEKIALSKVMMLMITTSDNTRVCGANRWRVPGSLSMNGSQKWI
jgi:hypothetical protein